MRKFTFLGLLKYVIILFQVLVVGTALAAIFLLYVWNAQSSETTIELTGVTIKPKADISSENLEGISIRAYDYPNLAPRLNATELNVKMDSKDFETLFPHSDIFIISGLIILTGIAFFGLDQLRRMIKSAQKGNPFIRSNVWRIYILASVFFCVPLLIKLGSFVYAHWFLGKFDMEGVIIDFESKLQPVSFVSATLLFTIGKIMERGIALQEDQDLTI